MKDTPLGVHTACCHSLFAPPCRAASCLAPFSLYPPPLPQPLPLGTQDSDKRRLISQLMNLDGSYHGGLVAYIRNAKQLLRDSKEGASSTGRDYPRVSHSGTFCQDQQQNRWRCGGTACSFGVWITCSSKPSHNLPPSPGRNVFDGYTPSVPEGERLDFGSERFLELEGQGLRAVAHAAFVLVAGGLGERLGYSGGCSGSEAEGKLMEVGGSRGEADRKLLKSRREAGVWGCECFGWALLGGLLGS